MRKQRVRRSGRRVFAGGAVSLPLAVLFTGGALLGSALLGGGQANAASTVLANTCTGSVIGNMGDQVALRSSSLYGLVKAGAQEAKQLLLIDDLTIWPDALAGEVAKTGTLPVGQVPHAAQGTIGGGTIGHITAEALKGKAGLGLDPTRTLTVIKNKVAGGCGLNTFANNFTPPAPKPNPTPNPNPNPNPPSNPSTSPTSPSSSPTGQTTSPGSTSSPAGGTTTSASDPSVSPAPFSPSAGAAPGGGTPPASTETSANGEGGAGQPDIRNAGQAQAVSAPSAMDDLRLPMLLGVIALAAVTAALVRAWVLRRG